MCKALSLLAIVGGTVLLFRTETVSELTVDTSRGEVLTIELDVTFPHIACEVLSLDSMDVSGSQHLDVVHNVYKKRIDANGTQIEEAALAELNTAPDPELHSHGSLTEQGSYCGSCYGAEEQPGDCCNTCEEVREAYRRKGWALTDPDGVQQCTKEGLLQQFHSVEGEGCHIYGSLEVNKVRQRNITQCNARDMQHHQHMHVYVHTCMHNNYALTLRTSSSCVRSTTTDTCRHTCMHTW